MGNGDGKQKERERVKTVTLSAWSLGTSMLILRLGFIVVWSCGKTPINCYFIVWNKSSVKCLFLVYFQTKRGWFGAYILRNKLLVLFLKHLRIICY